MALLFGCATAFAHGPREGELSAYDILDRTSDAVLQSESSPKIQGTRRARKLKCTASAKVAAKSSGKQIQHDNRGALCE
ncbi:MAG: hypothetical protein A2X94_07180 [Bdellovibrionales bacterium GWB1_55_8]|nr:MAG: hypothetical protein A2X94_07180 [Bdellovibrionales bacterium GWB1_55_8]